MQDWPIPTTLKQLKGFLGLTVYYRRFIKGFASLNKPLTQLLKKNAFKWTSEAQLSFKALKRAMMEAPILGLPNFRLENGAVDALYRLRSGTELLSIFVSDEAVCAIITSLRNGQTAKKHYAWINEKLLRKGKRVVGQNENLRRELL
ncbi:hypothetical protein Tco_1249627 [Tanacetum coccineum]